MKAHAFVAAAALTAGLLTALPLQSAEKVAVPEAAPAPSAGADLFLPPPVERFFTTQGPCTVSVRCKSGVTISCSGVMSCQWRGDNPPTSTGFVQCDFAETDCGLP